jgi:hypothetical protein
VQRTRPPLDSIAYTRPQVKGYHDISPYPNAYLIPGLVLFRWDAPLFFANAEFFHDRVLDAVASSPTPVHVYSCRINP